MNKIRKALAEGHEDLLQQALKRVHELVGPGITADALNKVLESLEDIEIGATIEDRAPCYVVSKSDMDSLRRLSNELCGSRNASARDISHTLRGIISRSAWTDDVESTDDDDQVDDQVPETEHDQVPETEQDREHRRTVELRNLDHAHRIECIELEAERAIERMKLAQTAPEHLKYGDPDLAQVMVGRAKEALKKLRDEDSCISRPRVADIVFLAQKLIDHENKR